MICGSCGQENPAAFRFCSACGSALASEAPAGVRKTVTVLFCDLVGSTALGERTDPEVLRELMVRYHTELRAILERNGGTVEKFVGDAAMAIFGLPQVHEDDALRAVRAAVEMRAAVASLGFEVRIGVNTGEVVAGAGDTLATGDAVNVAARLEQAAGTGEILIGAATERLVRDAIRAEAVEPLALKGKSEPVPAFGVLGCSRRAGVHAPDRRAVRRPRGGARAAGARSRARPWRARRRSSRRSWDRRGSASRGSRANCSDGPRRGSSSVAASPYGEGISYWPLAEMVVAGPQACGQRSAVME